MKSRRYEEFATQSSIGRDRGTDPSLDRFLVSRSRRSTSPRRMDDSHQRRVFHGDRRRSSSLERSDCGRDFDASRVDCVRSHLPVSGEARREPRYAHGSTDKEFPLPESHRRYGFTDCVDVHCDDISGGMDEYGSKNRSPKTIREEFTGDRLGGGLCRMSDRRSFVLDNDRGQIVYRLRDDLGPTSKYDNHGGNLFSSAMKLGHLSHERDHYQEALLFNKVLAVEPNQGREGNVLPARDGLYSNIASSHDSIGTSHLKDPTSRTSGNSRVDFQEYHERDVPFSAEGHTSNSIKIMKPLNYSYGQRHISSERDEDIRIQDDPTQNRRDTFSPSGDDYHDYSYRRLVRKNDDYVYQSDRVYRSMDLSKNIDCGRQYESRHGIDLQDQVDHGHRDMLRSSLIGLVADTVNKTENSHACWDHSLEKQRDYIDLRRFSPSLKQGALYLDSVGAYSEPGRKTSREQEYPYSSMFRGKEVSQMRTAYEISHMRTDYEFSRTRSGTDFMRDADREPHNQRLRGSPEFQYDTKMRRLAERADRMEEEDLRQYDAPDRILKRKYEIEEEISGRNSTKWSNSSRRLDKNERGEESLIQDDSYPYFSKHGGYAFEPNVLVESEYDGSDDYIDSTLDQFSSHDASEYSPSYFTRSNKSKKFSKDLPRSDSLNYDYRKRHVLPRGKNIWIRNKGNVWKRGQASNAVDVREAEGDYVEDLASSAKVEPPEDSEFKKLVQKYFLTFTKKLYENSVARKRYEEEGRAGSLFCIVCRRSQSKEFMGTRQLAKHALMSNKAGMRAQHLALHKAICILLGWKAFAVSSDPIKWVPEALSRTEASVQKEDLIIWPPVVVIHNLSNPNGDLEGEGVRSSEALGDFLRVKGFSCGNIKEGNPAKHGIFVVKFLGTFSGLRDAEKLHRYFTESKHGRRELEEYSKNPKSSNGEEAKGGKGIDPLLYGYMGIAEDLDKIDLDTKKKSFIRSMKEILEFVEAPVKSE